DKEWTASRFFVEEKQKRSEYFITSRLVLSWQNMNFLQGYEDGTFLFWFETLQSRKIVESRTPKKNLPYSTALKRTTCSSMQTEPIQIQENSSPSQTISKPFPSPSNEEYITIKLKDWLEIVKSNKSSIIKEKNITKIQKNLKTVPQNKKKKKNLSIQNENEQKEKINVNKDVQFNIQQKSNSTSSKEFELEIHPSDESLIEMDLSDEARVGTAKPKVFKSKFFRKPK
ncbi:hypothetical protein HNY73_011626, partial [Argiope bruennichi]